MRVTQTAARLIIPGMYIVNRGKVKEIEINITDYPASTFTKYVCIKYCAPTVPIIEFFPLDSLVWIEDRSIPFVPVSLDKGT